MKTHETRFSRQSGYLLLEVLVSLAIFSVGVLGAAALQAVSIKNDSAAKYRIDASALANELIGRMWSSDRNPAALQAAFEGSGGSGGDQYNAWLADVQVELPRVAENPPSVTVTRVDGAFPASSKSRVTVTVYWQMPGEDHPGGRHNYVAVSEIR
jgi:type IV pilus assembly protein PilV